MNLPSVATVAATIDHAILRPTITRRELEAELHLAAEYGIFSVCVRPSDVAHAVDILASLGSSVRVGTVIGFPHGVTSTAAKVAEVRQALSDGASEFDVVVNVGWIKSNMVTEAAHDLEMVVDAAQGHVVKVILETSLLTMEEKLLACRVSELAGADFVKTATGFADGGATAADLLLMRAAAPEGMEIKASGGVRDLDTLLAFRALGVTRFGTSATSTILDVLEARLGGDLYATGSDEGSY